MLFFLAKSFFKREGVRFIDFVGNVFADPRPRLIQLQRSVFLRHLLHANQNLHESTPILAASTAAAKLVSINELERRHRHRIRLAGGNLDHLLLACDAELP